MAASLVCIVALFMCAIHHVSCETIVQLWPTHRAGSVMQTLKGMLEDQASMCQDILQMEEQVNSGIEDRSGQKWPLLTLARLKEVQHHLSHPTDSTCPEAQKIYRTLIEIDPFRKGYYHDAMHGKATMVIRSLNSAISTPP